MGIFFYLITFPGINSNIIPDSSDNISKDSSVDLT